jgi:hypothetical protein
MPSSHDALLLRVELMDFKPAIDREVLVDPNITLRALHTVIQAAMGWESAHLYAFAQPLRSTESFWKIPNLRKWQKPSPDRGLQRSARSRTLGCCLVRRRS